MSKPPAPPAAEAILRPPRARHVAATAALLGLLLATTAGVARAQLVMTLRQGKAWLEGSDLHLLRPGATDVELRDVGWDDRSYSSPINFGVGLTWWLPPHPHWGLGLDLTHVKAVLLTEESALAQGRVDGVPIDAPVRVGDIVPRLELAHGIELLTAGADRRWLASPGASGRGVALFLGLGAGIAIAHVDAEVGGARTSGYQLAGPAARGVVGLDVPFDENVSLVFESSLGWVDLRADLAGGGRVDTRLVVPQLTLGISLRD